MRLRRLIARGFRNLADLECEPPAGGVALLGANAQGKTNFLEAVYYGVLFRSFRGAGDAEVVRFGGPGFHLTLDLDQTRPRSVAATYHSAGRRKRIALDGEEPGGLAEVVGAWLAVAFLPADVGLASGPAAERRRYLDRLLALAHPGYLTALIRYRGALAQRNGALRQGRSELARAFDAPLAAAGAAVVRARQAWALAAAGQFAAELECLAERAGGRLRYRGTEGLEEPGAWNQILERALPADRARGTTTVGPHRDDLLFEVGGRPLREFGSTGQQRSAAVALKLIEITTLREARGTEPALLLDDVFAELDRDRQRRLGRRLLGSEERQVFLTAPRADELPPELELPVWTVKEGKVLNGEC